MSDEWTEFSTEREKLTKEQRIAVAERLAAMTVFGGLTGFATGGQVPADPASRLAVPIECAGGFEQAFNHPVEVTPAIVREILGMGLFGARAPGVVGWAHQQYPEFLAARYLARRRLPATQLRNLVMSPDSGHVLPQTRAVGAWLVALETPIADELIAADPEAPVASGIVLPHSVRETVIDQLLTLARERWTDRLLGHDYSRLAHPGLAEQLRPLLSEQRSDRGDRVLAVEIAADTLSQDLLADLLGIALSPDERTHLRATAANAVTKSGDGASQGQLAPLARGEAGDDPDDELRAAGLRALWPGHINVDELVGYLTRPKRRRLIGSYRMFLSELPRTFEAGDLPAMLRWLARHLKAEREAKETLTSAMEELLQGLVERSLARLEDGATRSALLDVAWEARHGWEPLLRRQESLAAPTRRTLLGGVLDRLDEEPEALFDVPGLFDGQLLNVEDLSWLVAEHRQSDDPQRRAFQCQLISWAFSPDIAEHREVAFQVTDARGEDARSAELYDAVFGSLVEPVRLDSDLAEKARERHHRIHGPPTERKAAKLTLQDVCDHAREHLEAVEQGDAEAYWRCDYWLIVDPGPPARRHDLCDHLTEQPAWHALSEAERTRIVAAAHSYVLRADPKNDEWLGTNKIFRPALAGYRALVLVHEQAQHLTAALPDEVWRRWAAAVYDSPFPSSDGPTAVKVELLRRAYAAAPDEVLEAVRALLDKARNQERGLSGSEFLDAIWDRRLADTIYEWFAVAQMQGELADDLLDLLVGHNHQDTIAGVRVALDDRQRRTDPEAAYRAARVLLRHDAAAHWPLVQPLFESDRDFGREVSLGLSDEAWLGLARLEPEAVAWLYEWLAETFPAADDPQHDEDEAYWRTPRDNVARCRDRLPGALVARGSDEAVVALRRLAVNHAGLRAALREAEAEQLERSWAPVAPARLLRLFEEADARVVRDASDLMAIVEESFDRYQEHLQSEGHAAADLWDEHARRPKSEVRLSQHLARFLRADLRERALVVNCEVEVHPPPTGTGLGPRSDMKVEAFAEATAQPLSLIIEVKGCWHRRLIESLDDQLVTDYLESSSSRHGLYVVFWFDPAGWDAGDRNRATARRHSFEGLSQTLAGRAWDASQDGLSLRARVIDGTIPRTS